MEAITYTEQQGNTLLKQWEKFAETAPRLL